MAASEKKKARVWISACCAARVPGKKPERCPTCGAKFRDVTDLDDRQKV